MAAHQSGTVHIMAVSLNQKVRMKLTHLRNKTMNKVLEVKVEGLGITIAFILLIVYFIAPVFVYSETYATITYMDYNGNNFLVWDSKGNVYNMKPSLFSPYPEKLFYDIHWYRCGCNVYVLKLRGVRIPRLRLFPNIVGFEQYDCYPSNEGV